MEFAIIEVALSVLMSAMLLLVVIYIGTHLALRNFFGAKSWDEVEDE